MKNNQKPVGAGLGLPLTRKEYQKNNTGITLIALIVTIIVLLILAGVSLSLVAGGNGIIGKAANAVNETDEKTAVEEVELVIAEANMEYYLDDTVTNETLAQYLAKKFSPYPTGSGAEITFNEDGTIQYEGANGDLITLEMNENGKVDITGRADGSKITKTVTYDANGGTGSVPATQTVERKATVNVDFSTLPTREGYNFLGWATTANAETAQYTQTGTTSFTIGTSNVTLYAVWQETQQYNSQHPELHIPTGFVHTTGTVNEGYVIADSEKNEFVWIPIANSSEYTKKSNSELIQGDVLGTDTILGKNVTNTLATYPEAELVNKAGGFWVGRYEAGMPSIERNDYLAGIQTNHSTSEYDTSNAYWDNQKIIVQAGAEPARMITQAKSLELANHWRAGNANKEQGTVAFQSGLITGTQWDTMCDFIGWDICNTNCSSWANCSNAIGATYTGLHSTDAKTDWISGTNITKLGDDTNRWIFPTGKFINSDGNSTAKKNIYDIAGNVWEWTTEVMSNSTSSSSVMRGSCAANKSIYATARTSEYSATLDTNWSMGFRIVLYVE